MHAQHHGAQSPNSFFFVCELTTYLPYGSSSEPRSPYSVIAAIVDAPAHPCRATASPDEASRVYLFEGLKTPSPIRPA
jgi:hypothetical protein